MSYEKNHYIYFNEYRFHSADGEQCLRNQRHADDWFRSGAGFHGRRQCGSSSGCRLDFDKSGGYELFAGKN